jgi:hypothetical protein
MGDLLNFALVKCQFPVLYRDIATREFAIHANTIYIHNKTPIPDGQRVNTSLYRRLPYREIGALNVVVRLLGESPNPELRYASTCTPPAIAVPHATSLRDFADCESSMQDSLTSRTPILRTPKPRSPMPPVLHSAIGKSRFGNSRFLVHKVTDLAKPRIPTPQDPSPRVPPMIDGSR